MGKKKSNAERNAARNARKKAQRAAKKAQEESRSIAPVVEAEDDEIQVEYVSELALGEGEQNGWEGKGALRPRSWLF